MSKTKDPAVAIALRLSLPAWRRLKARADAQGVSVGLAAKAVLEREFGETQRSCKRCAHMGPIACRLEQAGSECFDRADHPLWAVRAAEVEP